MDMQKQAMKYWQLLQQGYSPADAYAQAFPNGIPTEQERLEDAAKQEQKAGLAQAGGVLAGALGARELARAVAGEESILGGVFGGGAETLTAEQAGNISAALDSYFAQEAATNAATQLGGSGIGGGFGGGEAATGAFGMPAYALPVAGALLAMATGPQWAPGFTAKGQSLMESVGLMDKEQPERQIKADELYGLGRQSQAFAGMSPQERLGLAEAAAGLQALKLPGAADDAGNTVSGSGLEYLDFTRPVRPHHWDNENGPQIQFRGSAFSPYTIEEQKAMLDKKPWAGEDGWRSKASSLIDALLGNSPAPQASMPAPQQVASMPSVPGQSQNLIYKMNPQEMAIQRQFGSQLAAALAGR